MGNERIYEIAFHSVGEGGPGGDAITIIYEINGQKVLDIVDCGTIEAGERIVERMQEDHPGLGVRNIVCTHGDQNHLSGKCYHQKGNRCRNRLCTSTRLSAHPLSQPSEAFWRCHRQQAVQ